LNFGSLGESNANALLDQAESMHAQQSGNPSGDPYFPPSVRQDFLELYSGLNSHGNNDDDKISVAELLKIGVSPQSLKAALSADGHIGTQ
jgi:hypothetical protein